MAWDIAIDKTTGDFLFGPTRDLIGVTGPELDAQRISIRCRIPRGTFIYDEDGTLGSFLYLISRNPPSSQLTDAQAYIEEALEDMDGVSVQQIDVAPDVGGQTLIDVKFIQTGSVEADTTEFEDDSDQPEFDARVIYNEKE